MRRYLAMFALAIIMVPLTGCSDAEPVAMPDVVGKRLDLARSDVKRAGFDKDVEVLGGGAFGILDETNWTVCQQEPKSGATITATPRIIVDRTCGPTEVVQPTTVDNDSATTAPGIATPTTQPSSPAAVANDSLTLKNSRDFVALIASGKLDHDTHEAFAAKYEGKNIEFDGTVAFMQPHGSYKTRFDFLLYPGDYDASHTKGPSFGFVDVNYSELHLAGSTIPDAVSAGQNYRFVATIEGYDKEGEFIVLAPVSTEVR